ncbi:MAG: c-type cytochrome domain-containing protein, partial [Planctomycetota bacterium JB042]
MSPRPLRTILAGAASLVLLPGLSAAEDPRPTTYRDDLLPILERSCLRCHDADRQRGGVDLSSYDALLGAHGGTLVEAGAPEQSTLWLVVAHEAEPNMPPSGDPLPDAEVAVFRRFIEDGLVEKEGGPSRAAERPAVSLAAVDPAAGRPEGPPPMPERLSLEPPVATERPIAQTTVACAPWSPLVALRGPRQVALFHTETGEPLGVVPFDEGIPEAVRFSRDGRLLIVGGGEAAASGRVALIDVETGDRLLALGDEPDAVLACDLSADRTRVALGGPSRRLRVFSTETGERLLDAEGHADWITAVRYSPDGVLLASADRAGGLVVREAWSGERFHTLDTPKGGVAALAWSADSNLLVSAHADGTVRIWRMEDGGAVRSIRAHDGGALALAVAKDGRIATAGADRRVKLFGADGKAALALDPASAPTWSLAFTHDDARLVAGDAAGDVRLVDTATGEVVRSIAANLPPLAARVAEAEERLGRVAPAADEARRELDAWLARARPVREEHDRLDQARRAAEERIEAAAARLGVARVEREERTARREERLAEVPAARARAAAAEAGSNDASASRAAAEIGRA